MFYSILQYYSGIRIYNIYGDGNGYEYRNGYRDGYGNGYGNGYGYGDGDGKISFYKLLI